MKVLQVHNYYQQPGGEDQVLASERGLLEQHGHRVVQYTQHNRQINGMSPLLLAARTIWNQSTYKNVRLLLKQEHPDIIHVHNTFPLISPAIYYAAGSLAIPVVQTLHNYRFMCPNALFYRDGHLCEDCLGKIVPVPAIRHKCYRDSLSATFIMTMMLAVHRLIGTYQNKVDAYICLTDFARQKAMQGGLPAERIMVKPNFVASTPLLRSGIGKFALFVGRLSQEKGIKTLLSAWKMLAPEYPLKIAGDGPLDDYVEHAAKDMPHVTWLGRQPAQNVARLMQEARCLIFPSVCYEGFPIVAAEAYAAGLPIVTSALGFMSSLVKEQETGVHFQAGCAQDLARAVKEYWHDEDAIARMQARARQEFEENYTAEHNYCKLMQVYDHVLTR